MWGVCPGADEDRSIAGCVPKRLVEERWLRGRQERTTPVKPAPLWNSTLVSGLFYLAVDCFVPFAGADCGFKLFRARRDLDAASGYVEAC